MSDPLHVLAVGEVRVPGSNGVLTLERAADADQALAALAGSQAFDAVVMSRDTAFAFGDGIEAIAALTALVVVGPLDDDAQAIEAIRLGAEDAVTAAEMAAPAVATRLRLAVERKRRADRNHSAASALDAATGLPNRQQFLEHLSQLAALREREPAPMAVVLVRVAGDAASGGAEAHVLKRKAAVKLRAGVRASDVVAWIGDDTYAVLLGALLAPADAERVAAKLQASLASPIAVGGRPVRVAATTAVAHHPGDGRDAVALLDRATVRLAERTDGGAANDA